MKIRLTAKLTKNREDRQVLILQPSKRYLSATGEFNRKAHKELTAGHTKNREDRQVLIFESSKCSLRLLGKICALRLSPLCDLCGQPCPP